jgi:phospholipid/cholesterol/gamma-HCH transport system ATP-binding protein
MQEMQPVISVRNIAAGYQDRVILKDISFDVYEGEVFIIAGSSGCGKSTLLKHLIGLIAPMKGEILIKGKDIIRAEGQDLIEILNGIGVTYQSGALFGSMTLLENVMLPLEEFTDLAVGAREVIAAMKLRMVNLGGFEHFLPSEISGGMQKRAGIARAMALDPKIIFFDEPSAGLDPITGAELDQLILRLSRVLGITFVVVTHDLSSIFLIADRVMVLDKKAKGIIAQGKPEYLKDQCEIDFVHRFFNRQLDTAEKR